MTNRIGYRQPQTTKQGFGRTKKELGGPIAIQTTDEVTGNTVAVMRVPAGFVLDWAYLASDKLDSNGTPTVSISLGDSGNAQRFIANSNIAQAGGNTGQTNALVAASMYYEFLVDTDILLTFATGSATAQAGNVTAYLEGFMR